MASLSHTLAFNHATSTCRFFSTCMGRGCINRPASDAAPTVNWKITHPSKCPLQRNLERANLRWSKSQIRGSANSGVFRNRTSCKRARDSSQGHLRVSGPSSSAVPNPKMRHKRTGSTRTHLPRQRPQETIFHHQQRRIYHPKRSALEKPPLWLGSYRSRTFHNSTSEPEAIKRVEIKATRNASTHLFAMRSRSRCVATADGLVVSTGIESKERRNKRGSTAERAFWL